MKGLRGAALGLVVVLCLLAAAPAVSADDGWVPTRSAVRDPAGWITDWLLARVSGWLGWGAEQPRATTEAARGDCTLGADPDGSCRPAPAPTPAGDCTLIIDPDGHCAH